MRWSGRGRGRGRGARLHKTTKVNGELVIASLFDGPDATLRCSLYQVWATLRDKKPRARARVSSDPLSRRALTPRQARAACSTTRPSATPSAMVRGPARAASGCSIAAGAARARASRALGRARARGRAAGRARAASAARGRARATCAAARAGEVARVLGFDAALCGRARPAGRTRPRDASRPVADHARARGRARAGATPAPGGAPPAAARPTRALRAHARYGEALRFRAAARCGGLAVGVFRPSLGARGWRVFSHPLYRRAGPDEGDEGALISRDEVRARVRVAFLFAAARATAARLVWRQLCELGLDDDDPEADGPAPRRGRPSEAEARTTTRSPSPPSGGGREGGRRGRAGRR